MIRETNTPENENVEHTRPIRFSELLENPPPDNVLRELFPRPKYAREYYITTETLTILKLRIKGLTYQQIADQMAIKVTRVAYWIPQLKFTLRKYPIPKHIIMDVPIVSRMFGLDIPLDGRCTRLSELLKDMPSDAELIQLYADRGIPIKENSRRPLIHKDLYLIQQLLAGRSFDELEAELGIKKSSLKQALLPIYQRLVKDLGIEIDVPDVFHSPEALSKKHGGTI